jgi:hypothetical protein
MQTMSQLDIGLNISTKYPQNKSYFRQNIFVPVPVVARSTAAWLLGLRVRILRGVWTFVSFERCVLSLEVSQSGLSLVQRSPIEYGLSN